VPYNYSTINIIKEGKAKKDLDYVEISKKDISKWNFEEYFEVKNVPKSEWKE